MLSGDMEWNYDTLFMNSGKQTAIQKSKEDLMLQNKLKNIPKTRHRSEYRLRQISTTNATARTNKFCQIAPFIFYPLLNSLLQQNIKNNSSNTWSNNSFFNQQKNIK